MINPNQPVQGEESWEERLEQLLFEKLVMFSKDTPKIIKYGIAYSKTSSILGILVLFIRKLLAQERERMEEVVKEKIDRMSGDVQRDWDCMCSQKKPSCGCMVEDYNLGIKDFSEKLLKSLKD